LEEHKIQGEEDQALEKKIKRRTTKNRGTGKGLSFKFSKPSSPTNVNCSAPPRRKATTRQSVVEGDDDE